MAQFRAFCQFFCFELSIADFELVHDPCSRLVRAELFPCIETVLCYQIASAFVRCELHSLGVGKLEVPQSDCISFPWWRSVCCFCGSVFRQLVWVWGRALLESTFRDAMCCCWLRSVYTATLAEWKSLLETIHSFVSIHALSEQSNLDLPVLDEVRRLLVCGSVAR